MQQDAETRNKQQHNDPAEGQVTYCGNCSLSNMNYINNWKNVPICGKSKRTSLEVIRGARIIAYLNVVLLSDLPLSKTGRCKNFPLCMMWRASRIGVSIVPHSGFGVMTWYEISILGISASKYNISSLKRGKKKLCSYLCIYIWNHTGKW